jgi:uncharacterized protein YecE (DUF72 family)
VLLIGTSGWSYEDWVGPVYAPEFKERRGAWLELYAKRFDTVEINSTFYRLPEARTVEGWVQKAARVGGPFEFSLKAPQDVTHTAMVQGDAAMVRDVLDQLRGEVLAPLADAKVLGAVLLQLSPHFHGGEEQTRMLDLALGALQGFEVAVEFRHRTWVEGRNLAPEAADVLRSHGAALCAVDGPSFPPMLRDIGRHAYVRFHGRRADVWFARGKARETEDGLPARYDYSYTKAELEPWARVLQANDPTFARVRAYFNNHPRGQAVQNAEEMRGLLGLSALVRTKPDLKPEGRAQRTLGDY